MMMVIVVAGFIITINACTDDQQVKDDRSNTYNLVIGTQTVGAKYKFSEKTMLVETAEQIREMGSNLLKFSMHPRYSTENYDLPHNDEIKSLRDLATIEPSMKHVLNMDFTYYHIWVYGFSQYTPEPVGKKNDVNQIKFVDGYPDEYGDALYQEIYDLASYLLTEYSETGKQFYLGHWEGDWHLRSDYDRTKPANPKTLEGMIKWEKIRQKAIDDAKRDTPHSGVALYNYIEVNLVAKSINEPNSITVTNSILREVNPDYVSYSSYDATNPYKTEEQLNENLKLALTFIESQLQPKSNLPEGKRVWIGEYGSPAIKYSEEEQNQRSIWTIKTGLEWGTPFILYWEMYNNEINAKTEEQVGYWLIDDQGQKQKVWHTHHDFYDQSRVYLEAYFKENNQMPTPTEFYQQALQFDALKTDKIVTATTH